MFNMCPSHISLIWQISYSSVCTWKNHTLVSCPRSHSSPTRTWDNWHQRQLSQPQEGVTYSGRKGKRGSQLAGLSFSISMTSTWNWGREGAQEQVAKHPKILKALYARGGHHRKHPLTFSTWPSSSGIENTSTEDWATQIKAFRFLRNLVMKRGHP